MPSVGPLELAIVLIVALIVFGPKKLPELGRSLGAGMKEFWSSISGTSGTQENVPKLESAGRADAAVEAER
jgi:sec-independent protein translocase protein TatA